MNFSRRSDSVKSSGIRRVFDLAAKMVNPINLSIGQPNFDAFPEMKEALTQAMNEGKNGYTQTQGIAPLRERIGEQYGIADGDRRSCFLTSGVSGGIFLSYLCLLDPGDEILVPDPYFVMYKDLATLINSVPVLYDTYPDFQIRPEKLEPLITPRTRAILLASPGNPTGTVIPPAVMNDIIELARRHSIWVIYDEIYSSFSFDAPHTRLETDYERVLILNGFSKSHGVCGWRIGYAVGPEPLIQQMLKVQQYSFVCAPSIAQWGVLGGFHCDHSPILEDYRKKRDFLFNALCDDYEVEKPGGAFYLFPKVPRGMSGTEFFELCASQNLLIVPGGVFSSRDTNVRISFSASMEQLERGADVLRNLAR